MASNTTQILPCELMDFSCWQPIVWDFIQELLFLKTKQETSHILVEIFLVLVIAYILLIKRSYDPRQRGYGTREPEKLPKETEEELIAEWTPAPLVPENSKGTVSKGVTVVESLGPYVTILEADEEKLNMSSCDFLGLGSAESTKEIAVKTLDEYTCGSCGPRGFYGTSRKHLELESAIAEFMGAPESIAYSDCTATVMSAIPAFSKRGDLLIVDGGCQDAVATGALLSRSKVLYFKHNDMEDLERVLKSVVKKDRPGEKPSQRRFIVVEGLYRNTGDVAPLKDIVALKEKYFFRLIVDDTMGFGALGETGRGTPEHCGVESADIEVLLGSLETSLVSTGGFCVGSNEVVDHQRLSGAGYCYSASSPPFLCAVAENALSEMQDKPMLLHNLHENCLHLHTLLSDVPGITVRSDPVSPVAVVFLDPQPDVPRDEHEDILESVVEVTLDNGAIVYRTHHLVPKGTVLKPSERAGYFPPPAIHLHVSASMSKDDIAAGVNALQNALSDHDLSTPVAAPRRGTHPKTPSKARVTGKTKSSRTAAKTPAAKTPAAKTPAAKAPAKATAKSTRKSTRKSVVAVVAEDAPVRRSARSRVPRKLTGAGSDADDSSDQATTRRSTRKRK